MPIGHITNISDFVWFQRSCGSMKSVSSFSSIDVFIDMNCFSCERCAHQPLVYISDNISFEKCVFASPCLYNEILMCMPKNRL